MIVLVLPDIPAEDQLLARARGGSQAALMQIYESYFPPVYQFIRMRIDNQHEAEDLAGDVFVKLVEAIRKNKAPQTSLRGWLFQVARNELNHHYGRNRRFRTETLEDWMPMPGDTPEAQVLRSLDVQMARRALQRLGVDQQEVLILRFGQMLSLEATADVMGKSVSAIKSLQFRAVDSLRKILSEMKVETER